MRTWIMWGLFVLGIALAGVVMGVVNHRLLELEQAQVEANETTLANENIRRALWQMDGDLSPLITDEATRPYFQYLPFYPAEGAYTRMFNEIDRGDVLIPSPLLTNDVPQIVIHFQFEPDGTLSSPQAPTGNMRDLAESRFVGTDEVQSANEKLAVIRDIVSRDELLAALPTRKFDLREPVMPDMVYADEQWAAQNAQNEADYQKRSDSHKKGATKRKTEQSNTYGLTEEAIAAVNIQEGPMTALWFGDSLFLARRISLDGDEYVQGCLLNWSRIQNDLEAAGSELLPNATFRAASLDAEIEKSNVQRLAALPVEVLPGEVPVSPTIREESPLRISMYIAWAALALVALGMAFVLHRTLNLAQRRSEFVSAVSHELRTPLTTFRMYTEMLSSGMVKEEEAKQEYLNTLYSESLRLGHLVENVLAYARLENSSYSDRAEDIALSRLIERASERLKTRTDQAKMELAVEPCAEDATVRADAGAVEQIVFNLVDNACKYAASADDRRIHIDCKLTTTTAEIRIRDHGPGIQRNEGTRLFKPFRKSAQAAANSAPGVGLGLTLSRRLARAMGGNLTLEPSEKGCTFVLSLPRA